MHSGLAKLAWVVSNTYVVQDVAKFLLTSEGLKKEKIGEWLGEKADFNLQTLSAFVDEFQFAGVDFDAALRTRAYRDDSTCFLLFTHLHILVRCILCVLIFHIGMFLSKLRLPGEAQKIDRMMERFAGKYCTCNPGLFVHGDAACVLNYLTFTSINMYFTSCCLNHLSILTLRFVYRFLSTLY